MWDFGKEFLGASSFPHQPGLHIRKYIMLTFGQSSKSLIGHSAIFPFMHSSVHYNTIWHEQAFSRQPLKCHSWSLYQACANNRTLRWLGSRDTGVALCLNGIFTEHCSWLDAERWDQDRRWNLRWLYSNIQVDTEQQAVIHASPTLPRLHLNSNFEWLCSSQIHCFDLTICVDLHMLKCVYLDASVLRTFVVQCVEFVGHLTLS